MGCESCAAFACRFEGVCAARSLLRPLASPDGTANGVPHLGRSRQNPSANPRDDLKCVDSAAKGRFDQLALFAAASEKLGTPAKGGAIRPTHPAFTWSDSLHIPGAYLERFAPHTERLPPGDRTMFDANRSRIVEPRFQFRGSARRRRRDSRHRPAIQAAPAAASRAGSGTGTTVPETDSVIEWVVAPSKSSSEKPSR